MVRFFCVPTTAAPCLVSINRQAAIRRLDLLLATMAAIALAILGKRNEPLYLREFTSGQNEPGISEEELFGLKPAVEDSVSSHKDCSVKQQFILHAALDRFDQIVARGQWRKQGAAGTDAMFVGLLCPVEDMRVYGKLLEEGSTTRHRRSSLVLAALIQPFHRRVHDNDANSISSFGSRQCRAPAAYRRSKDSTTAGSDSQTLRRVHTQPVQRTQRPHSITNV